MCNTLVCKTLCIYVKKARIRGNIAGRLPPHDSQRLDVIRKFYFVLLKLRELYELCVSVDYVSPMKSQ